MKELTVKEKAKRYDEAIERAIKHRNNDGLTLEQYETIDIILPELAESEDEKIRRAIRGWIYTRPASFFDNGISKEKMLAWLEKRGERPTNEEMKELLRTEYEKGRADAIAEIKGLSKQTIEDVARKVTSNKEHATSFLKSTDIMNEDGQLAEEYRTIEADTDKIEQKPDWGKEDEEILEDVRFNFMYNKEKMTDALIAQYNRFFDKIKSLKPQPQQEWSKEDEKIYQSIMDDTVQENQLDDKQTNWLENIKYRNFARPQNTWLPSKEQLHYLYWIANVRLGDSVVEQEVSKHLNELYNDLKKLKDETIDKRTSNRVL